MRLGFGLKKSVALLLLVLLPGLYTNTVQAREYDLAVLNGRVMDPESGLDAIRNVGVKDGKIAVITKRAIKGKEEIDASGHVVAPGFIDGHVHVVDIPLGQKGVLRDGVTTALELEGGGLPINDWYDRLEGKSQVNYGASVSTAAARTAVFDPKYLETTKSYDIIFDMFSGAKVTLDTFSKVPTAEQTAQILELIETGLQQGGLGVGIVPGYIVGGYSSQEFLGAQQLAGKYGRFAHVHSRFSSQEPPTTGVLAFQEALASAGSYGGGVIIAHFTAQALNLTQVAIDYVDALRAGGAPVQLELYPYNFGASGTGVSADYLKPDNYQKNMGRTYKDIIDTTTGKPLTKEIYHKLVKTDPYAPVLFYNATEADVLKGIKHPDILIGCDCFYFTDPKGKFVTAWDTPWDQANTHPRTVGTHGKVLRTARENDDFELMTAISKMSYQYAKFLEENGVEQMANKGRIKEGADADITIFNPDTVTDNSKLEPGKRAAPTTGIPYVVVNGTIVVKDSMVLRGVFPGMPIRAEMQ